MHPDYVASSQVNDLALVSFDKTVDGPLVTLNTMPVTQYPSKLYVAGWGKTQAQFLEGDSSGSEDLM